MPFVSKFTLDGQDINVKDTEARSAASTAQSAADTANSTANENKEEITKLKALSRVTVSYDETSEDITITTATHA